MDIITIKELTYGYEDCPVLDNFSCSVKKGEIVLLEGKNGAGKTTLLKCITSLINDGENIYFCDKSIKENKELLKNISFIMNEDTLYDYMTVIENIKFYNTLLCSDKNIFNNIIEILQKLDCIKYKDYLVKNLSQGTRNKIYLAIMLSKSADVFVLDEPFTALDGDSQKFFFDFIYKMNKNDSKTFIIVTHIKEFKNIATRNILIEKIKE
jgi:ABC-2 type transport system ATP-binding protein